MKFIDNFRYMSVLLSKLTGNLSKKNHEANLLDINVFFKMTKLKKIS